MDLEKETSTPLAQTTRRQFLTVAAGLVIAVNLPHKTLAQSTQTSLPDGATSFTPNAFVRVAPDNTVTVIVKHMEFGQGANTGLPILVAEELDADWSQMRAEQAPSDGSLYANPIFGTQGTGGSTGLSSSYMQMREAGATARAMLVAAAADAWEVSAGEITVENGIVRHAKTDKSATFGALANAAASVPIPDNISLKDPSDFKLVGAEGIVRLDSHEKSTGSAQFSIDVYRDGMQTVAVIHPPKFGATLVSYDADDALAISGVVAVREIPSGIAVYADNTYAAFTGRDAIVAIWDDSKAERRSTDEMITEFSAAARAPGVVAEKNGDVDAAFAAADQVIEAEYIFPYLAHAPMEPLDGVIELADDSVQIWSGFQLPNVDQGAIASVLERDDFQIDIKTMFAGGSFGRRGPGDMHFATELAHVAKAAGPGAYKLLWTRENDIKGGYYRPLTVHNMSASLGPDGQITGWRNTIANQSVVAGGILDGMVQNGLDPTAYEGSQDLAYDLPANRLSWAQMKSPVPVLWWRSVGHTHTGYAVETFLDQLLLAGGKDPVQGRLDLMKSDRQRDRAVLERVAEMANWSGPGTGDKRLGVAVVRSFGSYVAQVAEVEDRDGIPHVTRVWCAIDCGLAVTPDVVRAQIEGGIGYGLGAMLYNEIILGPGGEVQQSNFDTYDMLRMSDMPQVEVSIVQSSEDPSGVGEPGTPPIAPAVANAWRSLTGKMQYRLPFRSLDI